VKLIALHGKNDYAKGPNSYFIPYIACLVQ